MAICDSLLIVSRTNTNGVRQVVSAGQGLPQITLSENSQKVAHQQDHQHCAKAYPRTSAPAPPAVTVVSSAPSENERQNNDEYDEHLSSPFTLGRNLPGLFQRFEFTKHLAQPELIEEPVLSECSGTCLSSVGLDGAWLARVRRPPSGPRNTCGPRFYCPEVAF